MPETHIELKDWTFPQSVYESLGCNFYPCILEFYENEENKKAFEEWKKIKQKSNCPVKWWVLCVLENQDFS